MVELGQLEKHVGEFDARGVRIVAVSLDDLADTRETQAKFPHLTILSDHDQMLAQAADMIGRTFAHRRSDGFSNHRACG